MDHPVLNRRVEEQEKIMKARVLTGSDKVKSDFNTEQGSFHRKTGLDCCCQIWYHVAEKYRLWLKHLQNIFLMEPTIPTTKAFSFWTPLLSDLTPVCLALHQSSQLLYLHAVLKKPLSPKEVTPHFCTSVPTSSCSPSKCGKRFFGCFPNRDKTGPKTSALETQFLRLGLQ